MAEVDKFTGTQGGPSIRAQGSALKVRQPDHRRLSVASHPQSDGGESGVLDSILAGRAFFWRWALPRALLGRDGVLGVAWMGRRPPCGSGMRARHPTAAFTCAGEAPAQHLVEEVSAL